MTRLRQLACDVWMLAKGYWGSEERWSARVLLTSIIGLNLSLVGVNVLQNEANGALFTALQHQNAPGFYRAFVIVILLILLYLAVAVLRVYLDQTLQLRYFGISPAASRCRSAVSRSRSRVTCSGWLCFSRVSDRRLPT